jgi:Nitrile hydratase beta subunit, C-terminal
MSGSQLRTVSPAFAQGQQVKVQSRLNIGHCRTPFYLRGRAGIVVEVTGRFRDPELLAYHKPGLPLRYLYRVRFNQSDLWEAYSGCAIDCLEADIFEHWLEPAM